MSNLNTLLLECEYFPCIEWYRQFLLHENVLIEQYEYFKRASLRNRCYVSGPNGKIALSVPIEGGRNQRNVMKDIKISYRERWQMQHWRTLMACYNRSPYFEYYESQLKTFFETQFVYLVEMNLSAIQLMNKLAGIKKAFELSKEYIPESTNNILDMRKEWKAESTNLKSNFQYLQPFEDRHGFVSGLSMLDLLFCCGKQATDLLLKP